MKSCEEHAANREPTDEPEAFFMFPSVNIGAALDVPAVEAVTVPV